MGSRTVTRCDFGHSIGALSLVTQLRYPDKRIANIMEVYNAVYLKEQLANN